MSPQEEDFINFWAKERKDWSWLKHAKKIFSRYALPLALLIDITNFFIIGDTEYYFFSISHLMIFVRNLVMLSVFMIMTSGLLYWNINENRFWNLKRKYNKKS